MRIRTALALAAIGGLCSITAFDATGPALADGDTLPLESCIEEFGSLSVLFVVDASISLSNPSRRPPTDPNATRVAGIQAALGALSTSQRSARLADRPIEVFVEFMSFGTGARRSFDRPSWAPLDEDFGGLLDTVEGYADLASDQDTDYVSALEPGAGGADGQVGALELLDAAPEGSCRLVVWFTDGMLDFDVGDGTKVVPWLDDFKIGTSDDTDFLAEAARERLCAPGGLSDRLRDGPISTGSGAQVAIVTLGVDADPGTFELVERIGVGDCGALRPRGQVLPATDVTELAVSISEAVVGQPDDRQQTGACLQDDSACVHERFFEITAPITSFSLLAVAGHPDVRVELVDPGGTVVELDRPDTSTDGTGATIVVSEFATAPGLYQVEATQPDDPTGPQNWAGTWRVRFVTDDPALADRLLNRFDLHVYPGSLVAHLREAVTARRGDQAIIVIELRTTAGTSIADDPLVRAELELDIGGQRIPVGDRNPDGSWTVRYDIPLDEGSDQIDIRATVNGEVRLRPELPPIVLESSGVVDLGFITVKDPATYPTLDAPVGTFPVANQADRTTVTSTITASAAASEGGGCISLVSASADPSAASPEPPEVSVSFAGTELVVGEPCSIELAPGEEAELTVTVTFDPDVLKTADVVENGRTEGTLVFDSVSSIDPTQRERFTKAFVVQSELERATVRPPWWYIPMLSIIAALPTLLLLYGINWWTAKMHLGTSAHALVPVRLVGQDLQRTDTDRPSPLAVTDGDIRVVEHPVQTTARRITIDRAEFRAVVPRNPFREPTGRARVDGAGVVIGDGGTVHDGELGATGLTMTQGRHYSWVFWAADRPRRHAGDQTDAALEPWDGHLLVVVPSGPVEAIGHVAANAARIATTIQRAGRALAVTPPTVTPPTLTVGPTPAAPSDVGAHRLGPPSTSPTPSPPPPPFGTSGSGAPSAPGLSGAPPAPPRFAPSTPPPPPSPPPPPFP